MSYPMHFRWVIYESPDGLQIGHRWVLHRSHKSQKWVALESQDRLHMNHIWVTGYVTDGS